MRYFIIYFLSFIFSFFSLSAFANLPYFPVEFPRDEAAHYENVPYPVNNMTEWWYYNGHFTSKSGREFGYYISYMYIQVNIFGKKVFVPTFMIQFADVDNKKVYGTTVITEPKESHFDTEKLSIHVGKDIYLQKNENTFSLNGSVKLADGSDLKFSIKGTPTRAPMLISKTGLIDMWDNTNSYYYSRTHLYAEGEVQIGNEKIEIDSSHSLLWMDHQWGDFLIVPGKNQWFLALVQLENGLDFMMAMAYDEKTKAYSTGFTSIMMPDNSYVYTQNPQFFAHADSGEQGAKYYDVSIPEIDLQLALTPLVPNQNVNWILEAVSSVDGFYKGVPIKGSANVESTVVK